MLYDSIEFTEYNGAPLVYINASDIVFDNLSFRSCGLFYVMSEGPWWEFENRIFQNCEFAYGGGTVNQYYDNGPDSKIVVSIGDGIYSVVKNTTIRNNYFHNSITTATTYEWDTNETQTSGGYYHVLDNVIVNTMGLRLDSTSDSLQHLDSVVVRGNQIWNTGHWDNGKYFYSEGSIFLSPNHYGECIIEDNVLYGTENGYESNGLLNIWFYENQDNTIPQIRSNIYVQHADRKFGYFSMWEERDWYMNDQELIAKAAELLGDTTSEFYIIE